MKCIYIVILILFMSCVKKKEQKKVTPVKVQDTVELIEVKKSVPITVDTNTFLEEINKTKARELPIFEKTNFDSFIEPEDYKDVNIKAFKLLELYPNFYKDTHGFRAIAAYRISISENFYSVVVTIQKGDNEMESRLINYDLDGNIIDSKVVAYDEIAEGMSMIHSKIEQDIITIDNILWIDEKEVQTELFKIKISGKIELLKTEETFEEANKKNSYFEYKPEKIDSIQIDKFSVENAHQLGSFKIVSGNYKPEDEEIVEPETKKDWGDRLLLLNTKNEIVYKSHGVGDVYLYEPHFYKSNSSKKIIIICQLAFEYPFGGDAFIFENEKISRIGTLNIEGYNEDYSEESYLTNIVEINENSNRLEFRFKSDTLVLKPGTEDVVIKNDNVKYIYENNELVFKRK